METLIKRTTKEDQKIAKGSLQDFQSFIAKHKIYKEKYKNKDSRNRRIYNYTKKSISITFY